MYVAILFVLLMVLAVLAFFEDKGVLRKSWLLFLVGMVLTFYVAFRPAGLDKDYMSYLGYFYNPTGIVAKMTEPTFKLINGLARLCQAPLLLFVIYAFISVPLKINAIKRLSPYWYLSMLVWFTHLFLIQEMTQIRVAVASGMFLFAIPYIADGRKWMSLLCITLSILFHYSALALLPILFLGNKDLSRIFRLLLFVVPVAMYVFPFAGMDMIKLIPFPFLQQKIQMYEDLMIYKGGIWADINIFNIMALVRLFTYYMLLLKYDYLKDKYPYMPILLKIFCYSISLYVGLSFLPPLAMRLQELIAIIDCIMLPLLAVLVRPHWLGRMLVILYTVGVFMANLFLYKLFRI